MLLCTMFNSLSNFSQKTHVLLVLVNNDSLALQNIQVDLTINTTNYGNILKNVCSVNLEKSCYTLILVQ